MELKVTPQATKWFKDELLLTEGDSLRIYGKYGGATNVHVGFSTGIEATSANNPMLEVKIDGIYFFTEEADEWFFADYSLEIDLDEKTNEPSYTYK